MFALTGATGHLGQSIIRQLNAAEIPVGAVVRGTSNRLLLENHCEWIAEAPLNDVGALSETFEDCDVVIHAAAQIEIRRGHLEQLRKVNVEGTKNVLDACRNSGVRRLVYISSIEAINFSLKRRPIREDFGFARGNAVMEYGESKAEASRIVSAAGLQGDMETVLICPTSIIGPWDYKNGLFTTMIGNYLNGKLPASIPGGFDFVDVRDVAGAAIAAADRGRSGEAYLTSGTYLEIAELLRIMEEICGIRPPRLVISGLTAEIAARIMETAGNLFKKEVPLTRASLGILTKNVHVDSAKAAEELGYRSRPIRETLEDLVKWFQAKQSAEIDPTVDFPA